MGCDAVWTQVYTNVSENMFLQNGGIYLPMSAHVSYSSEEQHC
jgi:hypothetical protein